MLSNSLCEGLKLKSQKCETLIKHDILKRNWETGIFLVLEYPTLSTRILWGYLPYGQRSERRETLNCAAVISFQLCMLFSSFLFSFLEYSEILRGYLLNYHLRTNVKETSNCVICTFYCIIVQSNVCKLLGQCWTFGTRYYLGWFDISCVIPPPSPALNFNFASCFHFLFNYDYYYLFFIFFYFRLLQDKIQTLWHHST